MQTYDYLIMSGLIGVIVTVLRIAERFIFERRNGKNGNGKFVNNPIDFHRLYDNVEAIATNTKETTEILKKADEGGSPLVYGQKQLKLQERILEKLDTTIKLYADKK